jgi:hypothetical protein
VRDHRRTEAVAGERHSVIRLQNPSSSSGSPAAAQVRAPSARHQPTLIAAARSQTTASSPRGTFSQAELTDERVITRCITCYVGARRYHPGHARPVVASLKLRSALVYARSQGLRTLLAWWITT